MLIFLSLTDTPEESELCEQLYYAHRSAMLGIARSYLKNDQDAEDVVQTVFCEVASKYMKRLMGYDDEARRRFLFITTKHRALNLIKKNSRISRLPFDETYAVEGDGALDFSDDEFIERIEQDCEYARLLEAMEQLSTDDKALIWLRFGMELSTSEIAEQLGEKSATVTKRLQRAKKKLASILMREGGAA